MKEFIANSWGAVMDHRKNPLRHLNLESQHYLMQVLGWMWSMLFSLSFLSIFQFGYVWLGHLLVTFGVVMTVAVFREAQKSDPTLEGAPALSQSSACVWDLDREA